VDVIGIGFDFSHEDQYGLLANSGITVVPFDPSMMVLPVRRRSHESMIGPLRDVIVLIYSTTMKFDFECVRVLVITDTFQVTRRNGCSVHGCGM